jgi:threonylcarbamoyladenosine tRNA methylthiotransferase MtaB
VTDVLTFGCRLNTVESEAIRGLAAHLDDTVVINTCAVTSEAERQARQAIARLHRERPGAAIVVTGCAAQIDPSHWAAQPGVTRILGNREKLDAAAWAQPGSMVGDIRQARGHTPAALPRIEGRARAFVDVQQGCDHACTFCIIPQGRGPNRSVPAATVVDQVRHLVAHGCNEVVLTGVDLASWQPGLAALLRDVLRGVPGLPRLRCSSLDPAALDDDFWDVLATEERLMPHLHLSIQAASDLVLKRMRRRHSRAAALAVVARARAARPGIVVAADLIAGFPTESEAQFAETLAFVDQAALPYLHVFPYSARPGTPAARMPQVPAATRRDRAAIPPASRPCVSTTRPSPARWSPAGSPPPTPPGWRSPDGAGLLHAAEGRPQPLHPEADRRPRRNRHPPQAG